MRIKFILFILFILNQYWLTANEFPQINDDGEITFFQKERTKRICIHDIISIEEKVKYTTIEYMNDGLIERKRVQNSLSFISNFLKKNNWIFVSLSTNLLLNSEFISEYPKYLSGQLQLKTPFGIYPVSRAGKRNVDILLGHATPMDRSSSTFESVPVYIRELNMINRIYPEALILTDALLKIQGKEITPMNQADFISFILSAYNPYADKEHKSLNEIKMAIQCSFEFWATEYLQKTEQFSPDFPEIMKNNLSIKGLHDTPINRVIMILQALNETTVSIHLPTVKSIKDKVYSSDFELPNSSFEKGRLKALNQGKSYLINDLTHSAIKAVKR